MKKENIYTVSSAGTVKEKKEKLKLNFTDHFIYSTDHENDSH